MLRSNGPMEESAKGNQPHYLSALREVMVYRNGTLLSQGSTWKVHLRDNAFSFRKSFPLGTYNVSFSVIQGLEMTYSQCGAKSFIRVNVRVLCIYKRIGE